MSDCADWETLVAEMSADAKVALNIQKPSTPEKKGKEKGSLSTKVKMMRKMVSPKNESPKKSFNNNNFEGF